jgi:hypothetical protein
MRKLKDIQFINNHISQACPNSTYSIGLLSLATIKTLKTQEGDASPSGILNPLLNHTIKAMKQDIAMFNSYAHINMKDINHVVAIKIKSMKLLSMCVPKHTSKSPKHTKMIYATKWLRSILKVKLIFIPSP